RCGCEASKSSSTAEPRKGPSRCSGASPSRLLCEGAEARARPCSRRETTKPSTPSSDASERSEASTPKARGRRAEDGGVGAARHSLSPEGRTTERLTEARVEGGRGVEGVSGRGGGWERRGGERGGGRGERRCTEW